MANKSLSVEQRDIKTIRPYDHNPRRNDEAVEAVANSIREFGFKQPIVVDKDGVIVVGHTRYKAALKLGLKTVPVAVADDLTPEQCRAYRIADNKTAELAEWSFPELRDELQELADIDMAAFGFDTEELDNILQGVGVSDGKETESPYSTKVVSPIYEPKGECPEVHTLTDDSKVRELLQDIEIADLPAEVRIFLRDAAARHRRFDYQAIAEYYCHATPEVQRLMEASALVIIDYKQAIERGYVQLSSTLLSIANPDEDEE